LPEGDYCRDRFVAWIKKSEPELVVTCPVTKGVYLRATTTLDELAALTGIWSVVEEMFHESSWLRRLILCPGFRAAALADAI